VDRINTLDALGTADEEVNFWVLVFYQKHATKESRKTGLKNALQMYIYLCFITNPDSPDTIWELVMH